MITIRRSSRPLVVIAGSSHWTRLPLAEHHVARRLTKYARVLFVDPPLSHLTVRRQPTLAPLLREKRLRQIEPDLDLLIPVVLPGKERVGIRSWTDWQVRQAIAQAVRTLGGPTTATILTLPQRYLFDERLEGAKVYWAKDDHVAGAGLYGLGVSHLARVQSRLVSRSDRFLVCSEALSAQWRRHGADPVVLPNGCDFRHFEQAPTAPVPGDVDPSRSYAIYVGTLTDRIDARLLMAVADRGIDVLVVGAQRSNETWAEFDEVVNHPRVHYVGRRSYDKLPGYLRMGSVGLIPYQTSSYNLGSFPLKLLEYLAAGLPVVSTDLPSARWLDSSCVQIANDCEAFAELVAARIRRSPNMELSKACQDLARQHDWSRRAARLAELLGLRVGEDIDS